MRQPSLGDCRSRRSSCGADEIAALGQWSCLGEPAAIADQLLGGSESLTWHRLHSSRGCGKLHGGVVAELQPDEAVITATINGGVLDGVERVRLTVSGPWILQSSSC